ncbi:hypothetical protein [Pseudonocardia broussonetiae]|uniref:Uncharacterized protein n=1 Tax=Pseudonocardia broussonetiae TaxID=2736640 RepID=A0A6M6JW31_9PSEU|nr:hypothetical protein [Pseudonocardia broussonetiae]QJY51206.1 hypothetical protein HOP40_35060 [Pseudonocardia broussonetiae]QJY51220.1 hypothetical protein HOP40_35135 [Pseudonocardia broussonetiae]
MPTIVNAHLSAPKNEKLKIVEVNAKCQINLSHFEGVEVGQRVKYRVRCWITGDDSSDKLLYLGVWEIKSPGSHALSYARSVGLDGVLDHDSGDDEITARFEVELVSLYGLYPGGVTVATANSNKISNIHY